MFFQAGDIDNHALCRDAILCVLFFQRRRKVLRLYNLRIMDYRKIGNIFFKYRSYTPLPLVLMMVLFINPTTTSVLIGLLIAVAGESIRLWAVSYAGSETRVTSGVGGTYLVTQGPYGIVRNPLYWGNIFIYLGMGVMSNALFPYLQIFALLYFLFHLCFWYVPKQFSWLYNALHSTSLFEERLT